MIVCCGVAFINCTVFASQPASSTKDFYQTPSPLAPGEPGSVIRSGNLTDSAALPSAARNILVLYRSRNINGQDVAVSGTIAIPQGKPPAGGWPLITWTHGTTGIVSACAPSRDTPQGPEHVSLSQKQKLLDAYVMRGYAVVATDYQGLGPPGLHPFLQGVPAARGALDIMRAARQLDPSIGTRYVVMGHSQGGHADLFTAAIGPSYASEFHLLGDVALAPASHIQQTLMSMTVAAAPSLKLGYSMYVLESFASNHPDVDLTKILSPQALQHLPETQQRCVTSLLTSGYWATAIPEKQFKPDANLQPALKVATANEPANLKIKAPTFVAQGTADDTVLPNWTDEVVHALCKRGTPVSYHVYPGAGHEQVVDRSAMDVRSWIDARFAGKKAPDNCSDLPLAAGSAP